MTTEVEVSGKADFKFRLATKRGMEEASVEDRRVVIPDERTAVLELTKRDEAEDTENPTIIITDFPQHALVRIGKGLAPRAVGRSVRLAQEEIMFRVKRTVPQRIQVGDASISITHVRTKKPKRPSKIY